MKKKLNRKINDAKKNVIMVIVIFIFLIYVCLVLTVSNRRYLYIESIFKTISSNINSFFIDRVYSVEPIYSNVINSKIKYLEEENNNLKETLDLKKDNINYVASTVVNRNSKTWFDRIEINQGYDKKIATELPVINQNGLIGFISKTGKKVSEVKLLTSIDEDNLISVLIETENGIVSGFLSGYDKKTGLFKVRDVTSKLSIKQGDKVVLSGYDNETLKGIYVGSVEKEEKTSFGLSKAIWVKSDVSFDDLMFVLVPVKEDEK